MRLWLFPDTGPAYLEIHNTTKRHSVFGKNVDQTKFVWIRVVGFQLLCNPTRYVWTNDTWEEFTKGMKGGPQWRGPVVLRCAGTPEDARAIIQAYFSQRMK